MKNKSDEKYSSLLFFCEIVWYKLFRFDITAALITSSFILVPRKIQ